MRGKPMSETLLTRHLRLSTLSRHAVRFWCFREQRLTWLMSVASRTKSLHFTSENSASTLGQSQHYTIVLGNKVLDNLHDLLFAQMERCRPKSLSKRWTRSAPS